MTAAGRVIAVSTSPERGTAKQNVAQAELVAGMGLSGDAHAGPGDRQVSLLGIESIDKMRAAGADVHPGDFGENITTQGLDLATLPLGHRLRIGEVLLEVTQIGKTCHDRCAIYDAVGDCVMPSEGIFAKVLSGGIIHPQAQIRVEETS